MPESHTLLTRSQPSPCSPPMPRPLPPPAVDIKAESTHAGNLGHSWAPFLYTVSLMHCMTVSLAAGGVGLGMMWGRDKAKSLIQEAGFKVEELPIPGDGFNTHFLCTPM